MKTSDNAQHQRWWERCAKVAGLDLPGSLLELPSWILAEGETRRVAIGPSVSSITVGTGWTGRVLLEAVAPHLALDSEALFMLMDHALEGPLWLDVAARGARLEGAMFGWAGGVEAWLKAVEEGGCALFGAVDPDGRLKKVAEHLEGAHVAGTIVEVTPEPRLSAVLQLVGPHVIESVDLGTVAQWVGADGFDGQLVDEWSTRFAQDGVTVVEVVVPVTGAGGFGVRWWNPSAAVALDYLSGVGADESGLERARRLHGHSRRDDVARATLEFRSGRSTLPRLVLDMGLAAQ